MILNIHFGTLYVMLNCMRQKTIGLAATMHVTVTVNDSGSWFELLLTAPNGYKFEMNDVHELVIANAGPQMLGLWERAYQQLKSEHIIKCDDMNCEWCE